MMKRYRSRLLLLLCMLGAHSAHAQQELNVVSWDGAYVKSQILGFIRPYAEHANIRVNVLQYTGGIDEIRRQVRAWNVQCDVFLLEQSDVLRACTEALYDLL